MPGFYRSEVICHIAMKNDELFVVPHPNSSAPFLKKTLTSYEQKFTNLVKLQQLVFTAGGFYEVTYLAETPDGSKETFRVVIDERVTEMDRYRWLLEEYYTNYPDDFRKHFGDILPKILNPGK